MVKAVVKFRDGSYINLDADLLTYDSKGKVWAWKENNIFVGVFDVEQTSAIYISSPKCKDARSASNCN